MILHLKILYKEIRLSLKKADINSTIINVFSANCQVTAITFSDEVRSLFGVSRDF
ncbi:MULTISPECIES: hypothetical protein [Planktothrix]|uniref:Uncharacterized protein n=1 Tax=Planktothrix rubescens CCAP 1459/22 TaxID=329571 RepID=A0A6J7ZGM7_PLARU|nr:MULTISPECIES: hypothetical protein [Planktothrix]CAC5341025.1 hypothetical protein PLAN_120233 [Planktothrix rubescens NIVA-CYA 18]CAD0218051.1 conserved hypothetical protein [Planktothrix agardhii]